VPLCYPHTWQRVAVSVRTVVPRARLGVWIGEAAASPLVTTRACCPRPASLPLGRLPLPAPPPTRYRRVLGLPLPLRRRCPYPWRSLGLLALAPGESALCWRMPCPDARPPRCHPIPPLQPCCRRSTRTPLASMSGCVPGRVERTPPMFRRAWCSLLLPPFGTGSVTRFRHAPL